MIRFITIFLAFFTSVNILWGADFWTEKVSVTESANGSIVGLSNDSYASHAYSMYSIPSGKDGYFQFTVNNCYGMIGITSDPQGGGYETIDHAFQLWASNTINILENGITQWQGTAGSWIKGDVLKIERMGTQVRYYKNGSVLYTSTVASSTALYADFAFGGANTGFDKPLLFIVPDQEPAGFWTEEGLVVELPDSSIICIDDREYAGYGHSVAFIPEGRDGHFQFKVDSTLGVIGLTNTLPQNGGVYTYNYTFALTPDFLLGVVEDGTGKWVSPNLWAKGDILKIERKGKSINYYQNGNLFYTSGDAITSALYANFAIGGLNTRFEDPVLYVAPSEDHFWRQKVGVTESTTGSITCFSEAEYSAHAYSLDSIPQETYGYFQFTVNNCIGLVGLSSYPQATGALYLDHAFEFIEGNTLSILQNGILKWQGIPGSSWAKGDILKIEIESSSAKFYRNGILLYTARANPLSTLYADFLIGGANTGFDTPIIYTPPFEPPLGFWTEKVSVTESSDGSITTHNNSPGGSGYSVATIPAGRNGYFQFTFNKQCTGSIGLTTDPQGGSTNNIDYCLVFSAGNRIAILENGEIMWIGSESWVLGDIFKIERIGSTIRYYRNSSLLRTTVIPLSNELYADFVLGGSNVGFNTPILYVAPMEEPPGFWIEKFAVTESADGSVTSSNDASIAHAYSLASIPAGRDGYFQFTLDRQCYGTIGLNADPQGESSDGIDLAFQISSGNMVNIIENGEVKWTGTESLVIGDVLKIERTGIFIKYYRNNTVLYTTIRSVSNELYADFMLGGSNIGFSTPVLYISPLGEPPLGFWTEKTFVTESSDGSVTGMSNDINSAHAYSVASIPPDRNGYFQFTVNNCYGMVGLSSAPLGGGYEQIDYTFLLGANNTLGIIEKGVIKHEGAAGSWVKGDVLKIEKTGTVIKYYKNGTLFYSSTLASSNALYADFVFGGANTGFDTPVLYIAPAAELAVFWTEKVFVVESPNASITSTSDAEYSAHAYSVRSIPNGRDGYFQFTANNCIGMIGLTSDPMGGGYAQIDHALQLWPDHTLSIIENSITKWQGVAVNWKQGDVFKIERKGTVVIYYKNDTLLYTSTVAATSALYADFAIGGSNTGIDAPVLYVDDQNPESLEIKIYNFVTANGDGKNDYFFIENLYRIQKYELFIFNRHGNEVLHTNNYQNDWNGKDLEEGTYFYKLIYDGKESSNALFLSR